jgi:hypothetical protein
MSLPEQYCGVDHLKQAPSGMQDCVALLSGVHLVWSDEVQYSDVVGQPQVLVDGLQGPALRHWVLPEYALHWPG